MNLFKIAVILLSSFALMSMQVVDAKTITGKASYYGKGFHGKKTASGKIFNKNAATCAHRSLPFGTILTLTNVKNGKVSKCTVTDRGPFSGGRILDVSEGIAKALGMIKSGTAKLKIVIH